MVGWESGSLSLEVLSVEEGGGRLSSRPRAFAIN